MIKVEHNVETNEITEIPFTKAEEIAFLAEAKIEADRLAAIEAERKAKMDATNAPKIAALVALGMSEENAKLLFS
jgi:hypothetical protein